MTGRSGEGAPADAEVALLDLHGTIVSVNHAWERFARENGGDPSRTGVGCSFLAVCEAAAEDPVAGLAAAAVRAALAGQLPGPLSMVIPCHGPDDHRLFDMLVSPRLDELQVPVGASVVLSRRDGVASGASAGGGGRHARAQDHRGTSAPLQERVVQDLFAIAMDLQGLAAQMGDQRTTRRLLATVDAIDDTILAVRNAFFDADESAPR